MWRIAATAVPGFVDTQSQVVANGDLILNMLVAAP